MTQSVRKVRRGAAHLLAAENDVTKVQTLPQQNQLPEIDQREFRQALGKFATGVTIITAEVGGKKVGMTANSFSSLSLDPPLVLWSLRRSSTNFEDFLAATHFAVNVLSGAQIELSQRFARSSPDKFVGVAHEVGIGRSPIFGDAAAIFECSTEAFQDGGDHVIMIGRVLSVTRNDHSPLAFADGRYSALMEHPSMRSADRVREAATGEVDAMRQFVSVLLLRAYNRMSEEFDGLREEENLTTNESRVLNVAASHPGQTVSQIMPLLYLSDLATEDALQSLTNKGFLALDADRRVYVTDAGREKSQRVMAGVAQLDHRFLRDVPTQQVEQLRRILNDIIDAKF